MKFKHIAILLTALIFIASCKPEEIEPESCFTYTAQGFTYSFNAQCSKDAVEYQWEFGDNHTSSLANPQHHYGNDGTYYVTLAVKSSDGLVNRSTQTIVIVEVCKRCVVTEIGTGYSYTTGNFCSTENDPDLADFCTDCQNNTDTYYTYTCEDD